MKKFLNNPENFLKESLSGLGKAHQNLLQVHFDPTFVTRKSINSDKVILVSGGGSGHEPLHAGFIGHGMLDAACPGHVFTSPTPDQMMAAVDFCKPNKGALFIVKNYSGDVMNFEMAAEMTSYENASILVNDDAAVIDSSYTTGKRGVAGTVIVEKIVGSLAENGGDLKSCVDLGNEVNQRCSSIGVALSSCTIPEAGKPTFDIEDDQIEFGVGIHGEPGRRREQIRPAQSIVKDMIEAIIEDFKGKNLALSNNTELLMIVNGFGGTPLSELYLIYENACEILSGYQLNVVRSLVGNYTTALDMEGASVTLCILNDHIKNHWDTPVHTASLRWGI